MTTQQQALSILDKLLSDTLLNESQTDRILAIVEKLVDMPPEINMAVASNELYFVRLTSYGGKKIPCIKAIRTLTSMGLQEAKEFSESLPRTFTTPLSHIEAIQWRNEFVAAGTTCEIIQR